ncbi:MAG TPA: hypothetical protein VGP72_14495 [Planctomycetota bacterium]|jgi:hypothetical protein
MRSKFCASVLLMALAVGAFCAEPPVPAADSKARQAAMLPLLPACKLVVTVDVRALDTTRQLEPLWQKVLGKPDVQLGLQNLMEAFAFELRHDLNYLVVALDPSVPNSEFILLDGKYNMQRVQDFLLNMNVLQDVRGNTAVYALPDEKQPGKTNYAAFLKPTLIAFGRKEAVNAAIDRLNELDNKKLCPAAQLLQELPAECILRVGVVDLASFPGEKDPIRPSINGAAAGLEVGELAKLKVLAKCKDAPAAKNIADMAQGGIALLKLFLEKEPQLAAMLKNVLNDTKASSEGALAQLSVAAPASDAVTALLKLIEIQEKKTAAGTIPADVPPGGF